MKGRGGEGCERIREGWSEGAGRGLERPGMNIGEKDKDKDE